MKRLADSSQNSAEFADNILSTYNKLSRSLYTLKISKSSLTSSQVQLMMYFTDQDSFSMSELSKMLGVAASTVTVMVDRLEQRGLLIRNRNKQDRRVVHITLSTRGKRILRQLMKVRRQKLEKFLLELSWEEQVQFNDSIKTATDFLMRYRPTEIIYRRRCE